MRDDQTTLRPLGSMASRLVARVVVLATTALTFGSGEPQESFLYQNFVQASEALDRAVAAHGGARLLDRSLTFRLSFSGAFHYEAHYARPWASKDSRLEGSCVYSTELRALKSEATHQFETPATSFTIVGPANGLGLALGADRPKPIPEAELESTLREELEILPHEYLRQARAGAAGLRLLKGPRAYDVLSYTLDNGEGRALFLAADTHLLMRVERIGHWKTKGDRLEWRTFSNYADRGGIKVPLRSEVHIEGFSTQHNLVTEITKTEFGAAVDAAELAVPAGHRAGLEAWVLERPGPDGANELLPVHDLGKGAFVIGLPPSDSRSLLVAFSDFSVVVEAGDHSEVAAKLLATADRLLPDKPVRYVAMSHHHPLYANGLRPYAQRGVTILSTAGNVAYLRDLVTRPYRIQPDEQQRRTREPKFEVIDGTHTIADGGRRLEFYEFDYSTHVDEFVLTYLPSHKLIVTGDLVYILRGEEPGLAGARERAVHRLVSERKLDVEKIMQTWFLDRADHVAPYSLLEERIRLADERDSKK